MPYDRKTTAEGRKVHRALLVKFRQLSLIQQHAKGSENPVLNRLVLQGTHAPIRHYFQVNRAPYCTAIQHGSNPSDRNTPTRSRSMGQHAERSAVYRTLHQKVGNRNVPWQASTTQREGPYQVHARRSVGERRSPSR